MYRKTVYHYKWNVSRKEYQPTNMTVEVMEQIVPQPVAEEPQEAQCEQCSKESD